MIRTVEADGKYWFVLRDISLEVCANFYDARKYIDQSQVRKVIVKGKYKPIEVWATTYRGFMDMAGVIDHKLSDGARERIVEISEQMLAMIPKRREEPSQIEKLEVLHEQEVLGKDFKIYGTPENPLFLAKDVAEWIEYDKSSINKMLNNVDEDEKVRKNVPTPGGMQKSWFLTEDGLYEVLMQSRKPIAKQFKKQVKSILKSIRKYGAYMTPETIERILYNPEFIVNLATKLKEEQEKVKELTPKANFADSMLVSDSMYTVDQLASRLASEKVWYLDASLTRRPVSRNYVYAVLRKDGFLTKERTVNGYKNRPMAKYTGGRHPFFTFKLREDEFDFFHSIRKGHSDSQLISWFGHMYITPKGMEYFLSNKKMFENRGDVSMNV